MNIEQENNNTFISFFSIFDLIRTNVIKITLFALLSLIATIYIYFNEEKKFKFAVDLIPPNEKMLEEIELFKSYDSNYDLDIQKIYDIFIYNVDNKKIILKNLKKNIPQDHKYIINKKNSDYDKEIEKLAFNIKVEKPVLDKAIARIRNTPLKENYRLIFIGDQTIQSEILNTIKESLFEISDFTEDEIYSHKDKFIQKYTLIMNKKKELLNSNINILNNNYQLQIDAAIEVRMKEIGEDLEIVNKSLILAKKMNHRKNSFMRSNDSTLSGISEIQLNLSSGSDGQFDKIYYLKGWEFLQEEKRFIESQEINIEPSIFESLTNSYLLEKYNFDQEISKIEYQIRNLEELDKLIVKSLESKTINLFKYYITMENNTSKIQSNYLRLFIINLILGFGFGVAFIILIDSYRRSKYN